ncbi:hypothetical protein PHISCL_08230 [Aspergillus sclerotialis]|uniref:DUF7905 domain-containing protein n=1 Tax=Aspergillus sclerotialis TaxID=2070753 RepID=A0A3A2ZDN1_9EURO|nr:hypothetical protein PHISCL_08230 [Aspergillus sclerotialis]
MDKSDKKENDKNGKSKMESPDYELAGHKEWELPDYGAPRVLLRDTADHLAQGEPSQPPASNNTSSRGRSQMPRGRGAFQSGRGRGNASGRLYRDSPSKAKCIDGQPATGRVALPDSFGTFKHEFRSLASTVVPSGTSATDNGRDDILEEIGRKTGAYMKRPHYTDRAIEIWGEPAQVKSAEELLQNLISRSFSSMNKKSDWAKVYAHRVSKEAGAEREKEHEFQLQLLKREPDSPFAYPEMLLFLWPSEGPSMNKALGPKQQGLDALRRKFGYTIFVPKDLPNYICTVGFRHEVMREILKRLRTLCSEANADYSAKSKIYVIEPPASSFMKKNIILKQGPHGAKPFLQEDPLTGPESDQWVDQAKLVRATNDDLVLNAVEKSLQEISLLRGHLRMRINFGAFVFDTSSDQQEIQSSYTFEEFREMFVHRQAGGRLVPGLKVSPREILERCFKATELIEPIETATTSLEKVDPTLSVNFEFAAETGTLLRLEAEFAKRQFTTQYEITHRRWLKAWEGGQSDGSRAQLHIVGIDLERCDWQIETKSLGYYDPTSVDAVLTAFSNSIRLRSDTDIGTLTGKPQRNVIFPASVPVSRVVEKMAVRYRLKGTTYVLEIARYDEYAPNVASASPNVNQPTQEQMAEAPSTSWGASLFDSNWDNLLGQHGNLPIGVSTRYSPDLSTFFPPEEPDNEDKKAGFRRFIGLVRQVAEILGANPTPPTASPEKNPDCDEIAPKTEPLSSPKPVKSVSPTEENL